VLIKKSERQGGRGIFATPASQSERGSDRRTFLKSSGLAAGALAALGNLPLGGVR
jgi:formate dehydrogenase major subunit